MPGADTASMAFASPPGVVRSSSAVSLITSHPGGALLPISESPLQQNSTIRRVGRGVVWHEAEQEHAREN